MYCVAKVFVELCNRWGKFMWLRTTYMIYYLIIYRDVNGCVQLQNKKKVTLSRAPNYGNLIQTRQRYYTLQVYALTNMYLFVLPKHSVWQMEHRLTKMRM